MHTRSTLISKSGSLSHDAVTAGCRSVQVILMDPSMVPTAILLSIAITNSEILTDGKCSQSLCTIVTTSTQQQCLSSATKAAK